MRQRKKIRKIDRHIKAEITFGIVSMLVIFLGVSFWLNSDAAQVNFSGRQYTSQSMTCSDLGPDNKFGGIVFLGDSITALKNWNASFNLPCLINAGVPGNTTDDVINRLNDSLISNPRKIFLMIGVNDLLRGQEISHILTNYDIILNDIKVNHPYSVVYVQSVLPTNNDVSKIGQIDPQEIINLNAGLKKIANENGSIFIDLYPAFHDSKRKLQMQYSYDGVHLSSAGYNVWKKIISPYVR
jgi:lysophospholipase L1-like esterase